LKSNGLDIRPSNVAVLVKLETVQGTDSLPVGSLDAIPVEADSVEYNSPWTTEQSNEATGSLVAGAPLVVGQAATVSFRSRLKGAGVGAVYTASVKPPLHAALQACGWKGKFTAAISAAALTAGTALSGTLATAFAATAQLYAGLPLTITAGPGAGSFPVITDYTAGRVATLADNYDPVLSTASIVGMPANWSYASTSPSDAASRATDQPSGTIYIYEDGTLLKFAGCRGVFTPDGTTAKPGYGTFRFTGIYKGKTDAPIPADLVVAGHSAPVLVQGPAVGASYAVAANRKPLAISTWSLDAGSDLEVPENPNTDYGFDSGQIVDRAPMLSLDPLATLVANRDTITDIGNGVTMPVVIRAGSQQGNRWVLVAPLAQPVEAAPGTRGKLRSEQQRLQCRSPGKDSGGRDMDRILTFY
jgi:hypothetical protein